MTPHIPVCYSQSPPNFQVPKLCVVPPGHPSRFHVLGPSLLSVPTHWFPGLNRTGRCRPHFEPFTDCPGCVEGRGVRWRIFLGVLPLGFAHPRVLELTPQALDSCPELRPERKINLRGLVLWCRRVGPAKNAPVECRLEPADRDQALLPEVDVLRCLARVWEVDERMLDPARPAPALPSPPPLAS